MEEGRETDARREFKVATSTARQIVKVHTDMGKALSTVRSTLKQARARGLDVMDGLKLFKRAREEYAEGKLVECAQTIRSIKEILMGLE